MRLCKSKAFYIFYESEVRPPPLKLSPLRRVPILMGTYYSLQSYFPANTLLPRTNDPSTSVLQSMEEIWIFFFKFQQIYLIHEISQSSQRIRQEFDIATKQ